MSSFFELSPELQASIQQKQKRKQLQKQQNKLQNRTTTATATNTLQSSPFPAIITQDAYFNGAPEGLFRHPQIKATENGCQLLLEQDFIEPYNYFMFTGSDEQVWDPTFNARLAWEGFFTITHGSRNSAEGKEVPLPELQPFYGVLLWHNFERSKYVVKELNRLNNMYSATAVSPTTRNYCLINCHNPQRTWNLLNTYHTAKHGSNWLTSKYFDMMQKADATPGINFTMHCVELFDEVSDPQHNLPLSGEIGFSIGRVYTSLSGWTEERSAEGTGTTQLVLLGRWLQQCNYSFWSLGHCYSPEMDYKRQLGHRIFPRSEFLKLLKQHRGVFRSSSSSSSSSGGGGGGGGSSTEFVPLQKGATVGCLELIGKQTAKDLNPAPIWSLKLKSPKSKSGGGGGGGGESSKPKNGSGAGAKKKKVKPNEPCPCGSGKKYKKCCR